MPRATEALPRGARSIVPVVLACALVSAAACGVGDKPSPSTVESTPDGGTTAVPFEADPASVYVAKVKNILVGLPPTDAELTAVVADPGALAGLIDGWMKLPQYEQKMLTFFELAFQQTQISIVDLADQAYPRQADANAPTAALLTQNVRESFARTVLALIDEGRPLTEAMTTTRFMMTPALMELYAFLDGWQVDDAGKITDQFRIANPNVSLTVSAASGPIPIAQSLDKTSPNYMHWYDPDVASIGAQDPACAADPIVYPSNGFTLHFILYGTLEGRKTGTLNCVQHGGSAAAPQMTGTDFTSWKMVSVRPPSAGEATSAFYDLPNLRTANELVLSIPRVGFFSTPAFFANWQTNTSNQMRVTMNQALIVATGAQVDGSDTTTPPTTPGLDTVHASDAACFACHQTLDPTRSILSSTYSWNYHRQTDSALTSQKGLFAFQGVTKAVSSAADLGATLASHPLFAQAWAQKLCYYADSAACETNDPEFQRIVGVFQSSGYAWNVLVRELLSSPLTTHAAATKTATDTGAVVAVARRDHLCAALNNRFGFTDVCGLDAITKVTAQQTIPEIVSGLPSDGYGRGAVAPVLPNQPSLFFRAGTENICEAVASLVIDAAKPQPNVKAWSSAHASDAIAEFVSLVMALPPSDPRAAQAQTILTSHFTSATTQGASASDALKSTFVVACLAPSSVAIGL